MKNGRLRLGIVCCRCFLSLSQHEGPDLCVWSWGLGRGLGEGSKSSFLSLAWKETCSGQHTRKLTSSHEWVPTLWLYLCCIFSSLPVEFQFLLPSSQEFSAFWYLNNSNNFFCILCLNLQWKGFCWLAGTGDLFVLNLRVLCLGCHLHPICFLLKP